MSEDSVKKRFIKDVLKEAYNKSKRVVRIFIIVFLFALFYFIGFIPTKSMEPFLMSNDLVVFQRNVSTLSRGDIVSFKSPVEDKYYVKRIIGLPGEIIAVIDGNVIVDGNMIDDFTEIKATYNLKETAIGDGEYFVLGDNRNNSLDSSEYGAIKEESIKGKGVIILMPLNRIMSIK